MALIVEDGTGLVDAESPQSIAALDAYHAARGNTSWTGTEAAKEAAARKASDYLEATWGCRLSGYRATTTQRLVYPRLSGTYADGRSVAPATTPEPWLAAHAELSLRALAAELAPDLARGGQIKRDVVGPLEQEFFEGAPAGTTYSLVDTLLRPLLHQSTALGDMSRRWLPNGATL